MAKTKKPERRDGVAMAMTWLSCHVDAVGRIVMASVIEHLGSAQHGM